MSEFGANPFWAQIPFIKKKKKLRYFTLNTKETDIYSFWRLSKRKSKTCEDLWGHLFICEEYHDKQNV